MSRKPTPRLPDDLEKELQDFYASPEPRPEFVSRLERGLHSKLKEQEQQQMFARSKRKWVWAFGLAIAAVLIGLLATSPTVVAAMKRLFGYIPGVGLVESQSPLRVLAEPVSQTRDGITITVKEAVLSSDKTTILFTIENVPFDKLAHTEDVPACGMSAELKLPDGSIRELTGGHGNGWGSGYEDSFSYGPIPADVNDATLLVPCIQDVLPGVLPENWELPLHFVPAPPGFTVLPVIEYTPSPAPDAGNGQAETNPLSITKVIATSDSYLLIGQFRLPAISQGGNWSPQGLRLTDGNHQEVFWDFPQDIDLPIPTSPDTQEWAVKVAKGFIPPLRITYPVQYISNDTTGSKVEFEFDAGPNPQAGQTWELNKEIQLAGYTFTLVSISVTPPMHGANADGYYFSFVSPDGKLSGLSVDIEGYTALGSGGGGGGDADVSKTWGIGLAYAELPKGKLKIVLSNPSLYGQTKEWTLDWQPDSSNAPAPTEAPQGCLTLDAWQSAVANPIQLPADLSGKVISYGPVAEYAQKPQPENYGVVVSNLDGSNRQVVGNGVWPSLSPDGTRAAYAWENGIYVADLTTGQSYMVANTNNNDYDPRWSPDGTRLAFIRIDDFNLYLINPDGSGLQKVTSGGEYEQLVDWAPDGASLFYGVDTQQGILLRKLDLASGGITDLFAINAKASSFAISPDGNHVAFLERVSTFSYSLYVSNLDGTERKLIGNLGNWVMVHPHWSPDGKWLMIGILNTDVPTDEPVMGLIGLENCQIIPLNLSGEVYDWTP